VETKVGDDGEVTRSAPANADRSSRRQGTSLPIDNLGASMWAPLSTLISCRPNLHRLLPRLRFLARYTWWLQGGRIGSWPITSFYPFRHSRCRRPDSVYAIRRTVKHLGGQPHLIGGVIRHPAPLSGGPHQAEQNTEDESSSTVSRLDFSYRMFGCAFSSAPSGIVPVSRNRHNAIKSLRANAMIPIFLIRGLP
jgi:hypothetical protein